MSEEKKKLQGGASHKVRNGESTAVAIKRTIPERKADAGIISNSDGSWSFDLPTPRKIN